MDLENLRFRARSIGYFLASYLFLTLLSAYILDQVIDPHDVLGRVMVVARAAFFAAMLMWIAAIGHIIYGVYQWRPKVDPRASRHHVLLEPGERQGVWVASCDSLSIVTQGYGIDDTLENLADAYREMEAAIREGTGHDDA